MPQTAGIADEIVPTVSVYVRIQGPSQFWWQSVSRNSVALSRGVFARLMIDSSS